VIVGMGIHFATGQVEISKVHFFPGSTVTVGVAQIFVHVPRGHSLTVTVVVGGAWVIAVDTWNKPAANRKVTPATNVLCNILGIGI